MKTLPRLALAASVLILLAACAVETVRQTEGDFRFRAREAQARKERAELEARLRQVCPAYYLARQSCATAAHPAYCMSVRINNYSEWTDNLCRNR